MNARNIIPARSIVPALLLFASLSCAASLAHAEATPAATAAFHTYAATVEARLAQQHSSPVIAPPDKPLIERIASPNAPKGAMLHGWRGTAFARGATAADFERLMKNFSAYPHYFAPQVVQAHVESEHGSHMIATMRARQKHVITVTLDTTYAIDFTRIDAQHGGSASRSTQIREINNATGQSFDPKDEHGFLDALNTYWSYEERDGGLYLQIESISLTRSIPSGLGWALKPFVESIPRESLEFTLRSVCNAIQK